MCDVRVLFVLVIDWIMRKTIRRKRGIQWGLDTMEDLNFADDLALLSTSRRNLQQKKSELEGHAKRTGLHINTAKTKVMNIKTVDNQPIVIGIDDVETVDSFTSLGSVMDADNGSTVWASSQYRINKSNVMSVLLYGAECWKVNQMMDKGSIHFTIHICLELYEYSGQDPF